MAESAETEEEVPQKVLEQEVTISIVVSCRRVPPSEIASKSEEGIKGNDEGTAEDPGPSNPPPTLEELDCKFSLSIVGGTTTDGDESGQITFQKQDDADEQEFSGERWSHTFNTTMLVNQETVIRLCRSAESNIALKKAELDSPLVLLPIDLAPLVAGDSSIELGASLANTELIQTPYNIPEFSVKISVSNRFLTNDLEMALNPLCITIVAAEDLPDFPRYETMKSWRAGANPRTMSFPELREKCLPAYCTYCFMSKQGDEVTEDTNDISDWNRPVRTHGMPQAKNIRFKHKKVFLAGLIHPTDLINHLKAFPLEIELHDRETFYPPTLTDEEDTEEKPVTVWSGLKTIDKSRAAEALPISPCGICHVSLMPLCDGRRFVSERCNIWPKRIKYPDFSAHQKPTAGDYVNSGSVLVVKAEICRPLNVARETEGPFRRVVICMRYSDCEGLEKLNNSIIKINAEFLGKLKMPTPLQEPQEEADPELDRSQTQVEAVSGFRHEALHAMLDEGAGIEKLEKGLSTIELTLEECKDPNMDVITGVQIMDSSNRIFILEGLSSGITRLLTENPRAAKNSKEYKMLYHPEITFESRIYGAYHVVIRKIRLRENLKQLIANVSTYLEPKYALTAWALIRLQEIVRAGRMRTLRDLVLFPEVEQLNHMEKKVGDALSIEDLTGKKADNGKQEKQSDSDIPRLSTEELAKAVLMPRPKHKAPTDCQNPVYLQYLVSKPSKDFVQEYIDARPKSRKQSKDATNPDFGDVYNYGGQKLQYTALQTEFRQEKYGADYGKIHWTYSKDLLSGALVLVDPEQEARAAKRRNKDMWLTKEGFQWPKASTPKELNSLGPKQSTLGKGLTDYRIAENRTEWIENQWNSIRKGYENPNLPSGQKDFNVRYNTAPRLFEQNPEALKSVFSVESGAALEAQQRKQETYDGWAKAVVVQSKNFRVLWNSGKGQIDRLRPLLKNKPQSHALKHLPHAEGCQPGVENPPSMFAKDQYLDPLQTYVVTTYGASLRVAPSSLDDPASQKVMTWKKDLAVGVIRDQLMPTAHTKPFLPSGVKPKEVFKGVEKLHVRHIQPLGDGPEDRPAKLYYQKRGVSAA